MELKQEKQEVKKTKTVVIIKPTIYPKEDKEQISRLGIERQNMLDQINKVLILKGFGIERKITTVLPYEFWTEFYKEHQGKSYFDQLIKYMDGGVITWFIITHEKEDAIQLWRKLMGNYNDATLGKQTLRGIFGDKDYLMYNFFHGSDSEESFIRESELLLKTIQPKKII
jgi:nucleoside diphosphate kinase